MINQISFRSTNPTIQDKSVSMKGHNTEKVSVADKDISFYDNNALSNKMLLSFKGYNNINNNYSKELKCIDKLMTETRKAPIGRQTRGDIRFDPPEKDHVLLAYQSLSKAGNLSDELFVLFSKLFDAKTSRNRERFTGYEMGDIIKEAGLKGYTAELDDFIQTLVDATDKNGEERFRGFDIKDLVKLYTPEKKPRITELLNATHNSGDKYSAAQIVEVLKDKKQN